jgi:hypothetical protein
MKSKSNTVELRIWSRTTWQNLSLVSNSNIFANSLWTSYLMQQSLSRLASWSVLDNIYQSLTQSRYSNDSYDDHKMTQKPIIRLRQVLTVLQKWKWKIFSFSFSNFLTHPA